MSNEDFKIKINIFEEAFSIVNPSKVNLGKYRRELSKLWIGKLKDYIDFGPVKLGDVFVVETV